MTHAEFIEKIAAAVAKFAPKYGICVNSPIIAQACLESGYGTSYKAQHHNYFGLKYRAGRVTCHSGKFTDGSTEQNPDGSYRQITDEWYEFDSLEAGVEGYFQYINIARYNNLKCVTDPHKYLELIREDGYATSLTYVENVFSVVKSQYLERFDSSLGSNSPLVVHTNISPNKTSPRNHAIDTITIHCVVGQVTAERLGEIFKPESRQASSNYGVDKDGRVGMYVEEKDRSWCSSNRDNDNRAITIEVASDTTEPYAVTDAAMQSLIKLCADICKRNNIYKLVWSTSKEERVNHLNGCNMTVHRDYANKSCPGTYLYERHQYIADEVNKLLGVETPEVKPESNTLYRVQCGAFKVKANAEALVAQLKAAGFNAIIKED